MMSCIFAIVNENKNCVGIHHYYGFIADCDYIHISTCVLFVYLFYSPPHYSTQKQNGFCIMILTVRY